MSGAAVAKLPRKIEDGLKKIMVTPELATTLLERNKTNRPISDAHVQRIASQIRDGKWRFNGDTIKVSDTGDVLDGQHRLWAIIESKTAVETIIVYGIARDAFATIDTLRKPRLGADVLALCGAGRYRNVMSSALQWLTRWQRGVLEEYRAPKNRVENSDIEEAYGNNLGIVRAVERAMGLRGLANPSIMAFLYYVMVNRNAEIAERMMTTLENPAGVGVDDPFFRLRVYFTAEHHRRKEPLMTIALAFKAANLVREGAKIKVLAWKNQGDRVEALPVLKIS